MMASDDRRRPKSKRAVEIFEALLDVDASKREEFLRTSCGDDVELKRDVEDLLRADAASAGYLEPRAGLLPTAGLDMLAPSSQFGRYRIIGIRGRGGMGVVYEAEQDQPRRRVALKVIHPAWASPGQIERFQREAELLGTVQHDGIAQVFDSGVIDDHPYIAMELVDGEPLHRGIADLAQTDQLRVFRLVCDAVHAAHMRRVVHRDLKPENILVHRSGESADSCSVKIIDFGIARLLEASGALAETSAPGQVLGTLPYMSPEQFTDAVPVDTRTDVYQLGAILYEVLAGHPPHKLAGKSLAESIRTVASEPPTPLDQSVDRDLQNVVLKAMAPDLDGRYESAAEFGADLSRYLRNEPVTARPFSRTYALRKFVQRNRPVVIATSVAVVAIGSALTLNAVQRSKVERAMLTLGDVSTPWRVAGQSIPGWTGRTESQRPTSYAEAEACRRVGQLFANHDEWELAERYFRFDWEYQVERRGPSHPLAADAHYRVGWAMSMQPGRLVDSVDVLRQAVENAKAAHGKEHPETLRAMDALATTMVEVGIDHPGHEGLIDEAFEIMQVVLASIPTSGDVSNYPRAEAHHAFMLARSGRPEALETMKPVVVTLRAELGDRHPTTYAAMKNLAMLLRGEEQFDEALQYFRLANEIGDEALGVYNPETMNFLNSEAFCAYKARRFERAAELFAEGLRRYEHANGRLDNLTIRQLQNLVSALRDAGDFATAIGHAEDLSRRVDESTTLETAYRVSYRRNHGDVLIALERFDEAEVVLKKALQVYRGSPEKVSGRFYNSLRESLHTLYTAWGKPDEARSWKPTGNETSGS